MGLLRILLLNMQFLSLIHILVSAATAFAKMWTCRVGFKRTLLNNFHKSAVEMCIRDSYYRTQADPYLETREREELFVEQIVDAVENSLKQALPLFLSGLTAGMAQREPQIRASFPAPENSQPDSDVDWDFLGE